MKLELKGRTGTVIRDFADFAGASLPYLEYDAFSNLTLRENDFGAFTDRFEAFYTNNRKTGTTVPVYDVYGQAGNVVHNVFSPYTPHGDRPYEDSKWWTFDAAGRVTAFRQFTSAAGAPPPLARETKHDTTFDGDGRPVMEYKQERNCVFASKPESCTGSWEGVPAHYLISSVTGQKITDLYDGINGGHHVYMGQTAITRYIPPFLGEPGFRNFTVSDPVTGSSALLESDGTISDRTELAALGTSVPLQQPTSFPVIEHDGNGFMEDGVRAA